MGSMCVQIYLGKGEGGYFLRNELGCKLPYSKKNVSILDLPPVKMKQRGGTAPLGKILAENFSDFVAELARLVQVVKILISNLWSCFESLN
jgi:hypothetical protein